MYTTRIYTEVDQGAEEPASGATAEEALAGFDLTGLKIEACEIAGGDLVVVERASEEEPGGYAYRAVSGTANYANIATRMMDVFGEGMADRSRVFDAARIASALRGNGLYVFPLCNPFIDLLVSALAESGGRLGAEDVAAWIAQCARREAYALYDDASRVDVRAGFSPETVYAFYMTTFGQHEEGPARLAAEIALQTRNRAMPRREGNAP